MSLNLIRLEDSGIRKLMLAEHDRDIQFSSLSIYKFVVCRLLLVRISIVLN